jgi:hypothetical protein
MRDGGSAAARACTWLARWSRLVLVQPIKAAAHRAPRQGRAMARAMWKWGMRKKFLNQRCNYLIGSLNMGILSKALNAPARLGQSGSSL